MVQVSQPNDECCILEPHWPEAHAKPFCIYCVSHITSTSCAFFAPAPIGDKPGMKLPQTGPTVRARASQTIKRLLSYPHKISSPFSSNPRPSLRTRIRRLDKF